jgi:hypothetical protein
MNKFELETSWRVEKIDALKKTKDEITKYCGESKRLAKAIENIHEEILELLHELSELGLDERLHDIFGSQVEE